jgi:hypothetical protein
LIMIFAADSIILLLLEFARDDGTTSREHNLLCL